MKNKITSGALPPNLNCWTNRRARRFAYFKALGFLGVYLCTIPLPERAAAVEPRARATITFENGASIRIHSGREQFRPIEIRPGETVQIQLQLPPGLANTLVAIQALDGGLTSGDVVIAQDGTASIAFQAGVQPGLYRVLLMAARGRSATLQFSVPTPNP